MGFLDDMVAADSAIFVDADASPEVESVSYKPQGATAVPLNVQVFRAPPENLGMGQAAGRVLKIFVRRHATAGRTAIDVGADKVQIAFNKGETAEWKRVAEIESEDAGGFMLILE